MEKARTFALKKYPSSSTPCALVSNPFIWQNTDKQKFVGYQKQQHLSCHFCSRDSCVAVALARRPARSLDTKCLWCAGEDSNLQAGKGTSTSSWRVYHFTTRAKYFLLFLFSLTGRAHHLDDTSKPPIFSILFLHISIETRRHENTILTLECQATLPANFSRKE